MGLLKKLPSFSKKSRPKPTDRPPLPLSPPVEPLSLKLDSEDLSQQQNINNVTMNFNRPSNANGNASAPAPAPATTTAATATPNPGASLLDDIFSELKQTSPAQGKSLLILYIKKYPQCTYTDTLFYILFYRHLTSRYIIGICFIPTTSIGFHVWPTTTTTTAAAAAQGNFFIILFF